MMSSLACTLLASILHTMSPYNDEVPVSTDVDSVLPYVFLNVVYWGGGGGGVGR